MCHNDSNLNYQFQISTTFEHDDRIFFRKLAHLKTNTEYNNNWQEFATRGVNTFNGVQTINGDQYVNGNIHVNKYLFIPSNRELIFGNTSDRDHSLRISYNGNDNNGSCYINYSGDLRYRNGSMTDDVPVVLFSKDNNVGIGTLDPQGYKLAVNGIIRAKEIKVDSDWADFVFKKDYKLPTLGEVKKHITEKGTLPGIPSESDVKANGVSLGEVNALLLQKIEELTLYVIKQQEEIEQLKALNNK